MKQTSQSEFRTDVLEKKGLVLVDFYADWCGPCKMLSPLLNAMSEANTDPDVRYVKVNVDENPILAGDYGVMSIPTVILFKDGKLVNQLVGLAPQHAYQDAIEHAKK